MTTTSCDYSQLNGLQLALYDFTLRVEEPLTLPAEKGSVLRGGFGLTFKRTVCVYPKLPPCDDCGLRYNCAYPMVFEPSPPPDTAVLRKQSDIPTPFVLEPPQDGETRYAVGDTLCFRLVLIGQAIQLLPYFVVVFQRLGETGLGSERGHYSLQDVAFYHPTEKRQTVLLQGERLATDARAYAVDFATVVAPLATLTPTMLTLDFQTPTRIKYAERFINEAPPFHVLIRTLLRRVSSLSYFHGGQRWETDYRGWIEQAEGIAIAQTAVHWTDWERYSTRQQQRMNLGGIVGRVTYAGDLAPFLPLLRLGELVHVGKGTVFGNGQYRLREAGMDRF